LAPKEAGPPEYTSQVRAWGGGAVTTVTFEEKGGKTLLVMHELDASKEALRN
jgi:hypothetical protein